MASIDPGENFEDQMQSKSIIIQADSENESLHSGSDTAEQIPAFSNMNPQASCSKESLTGQTPEAYMNHTTEEKISSSATQTDQEFESSSVQTSRVEERQPRCTQTTMVQTDGTQNLSTITREIETDSVKVQTDGIWKKHAAVQTEKGAQTETAVNDASAQNEKREDIGTSTSFNVYVIDRENLIEKSVDTEDLPSTPLIVEKSENAEIARKCSDYKECNCFCGHRNHHRCIYRCKYTIVL